MGDNVFINGTVAIRNRSAKGIAFPDLRLRLPSPPAGPIPREDQAEHVESKPLP